MFVFHISSMVA